MGENLSIGLALFSARERKNPEQGFDLRAFESDFAIPSSPSSSSFFAPVSRIQREMTSAKFPYYFFFLFSFLVYGKREKKVN